MTIQSVSQPFLHSLNQSVGNIYYGTKANKGRWQNKPKRQTSEHSKARIFEKAGEAETTSTGVVPKGKKLFSGGSAVSRLPPFHFCLIKTASVYFE